VTWKNERIVHIGGEEWAWVLAWKGEEVALVRSPQGAVSEFGYEDLVGNPMDPVRIGLPGELGNPGITPGKVKAAIMKHLLPEPDPPHERYDIIGDVHGCFAELMDLMDRLGHKWIEKLGIHKPEQGRRIVFVGDLTDRGPRSVVVLRYAMYMVEHGHALWVEGNHDDKLKRWAHGNKVSLNHGLAKTVHDLEREGCGKAGLHEFLKGLPQYAILDHGRLIVVHAAWREGMEYDKPGVRRTWCLYGPTTGKTLENGLPDRIDWAADRRIRSSASPTIVYGHQPQEKVRDLNRTLGIDTGCCFGGSLTALRWPEKEIVQVPALDVWDKQGRELNGFGSSGGRDGR
jgi:protein phosphatase